MSMEGPFDSDDLMAVTQQRLKESAFPWSVTPAYVGEVQATQAHIDGYGHVNNLVYPMWAMEAAWHHSTQIGYPFSRFRELGIGFVIVDHHFSYRAPLLCGEHAWMATWISRNDQRVRITRCFEMRRVTDGKILFEGRTNFISIEMKSGRPVRMLPELALAFASHEE